MTIDDRNDHVEFAGWDGALSGCKINLHSLSVGRHPAMDVSQTQEADCTLQNEFLHLLILEWDQQVHLQ